MEPWYTEVIAFATALLGFITANATLAALMFAGPVVGLGMFLWKKIKGR